MLIFTYLIFGGYLAGSLASRASYRDRGTAPDSAGTVINDYDPDIDDIDIICFHGPSTAYNDTRPLSRGRAVGLIRNKHFDIDRPTALYFHGFGDQPYNRSLQALAQAFYWRGDYNFCALDWSVILCCNYDLAYYLNVAVPYVLKIAPHLAKLLIQWFNRGVSAEHMHLIGHSLGAQLGGYVANLVQSQSNQAYKVGRMTGLDPAGPGFNPPATGRFMQSVDATLVDAYHSNPRSLGISTDVGRCDYWFNDPALPQPGCDVAGGIQGEASVADFCSHYYALDCFTESVLAKTPYEQFYAIRADSWEAFTAGDVNYGDISVAGMDVSCQCSGRYYLTAGNMSHYTHALRGISYSTPGA